MYLYRPVIAIFFLLLTACAPTQKTPKNRDVKPMSYSVASKTSRADIMTETVVTLTGFTFTIEFADSRRNYEALRTNWRLSTQTIGRADGETVTLQVRDRATLHLSPRGVESDRRTSVASTLEFEMEMKGTKKDSWLDITPDPAAQEQYAAIVQELQNRLRHRGYQFN
jgi:hypothetical protein